MKLALLFDHFGPYHLARLRAIAQRDEVLGVEFRGRSQDYAWEVSERGDLPLQTIEKNSASAGLGRAGFAERLEAVLETFGPDVVAVPGWASWEALSALTWALQHGVPAVLMSESTGHDERRVRWREWVKGRMVGLFSSALAGGRAHAEYLVQLGMPVEKIFLGYDAVDNAHFSRTQQGVVSRRAAFLASARFIEKKNLPNLLRAYAGYRDEARDEVWPLTLLGDGPLRPQLEGLVTELELQSLVTMPGFKQYQDLPGYYAAAGAFIHASTTEQWGLVVNEAMASGLPVLVSNRCGCAPDLVEEGTNGFTFDPCDVSAMTRGMAAIAGLSPSQRESMGEESRRIIAQWGPGRFGQGLQAAAERALAAGPGDAGMSDQLLLKLLRNR